MDERRKNLEFTKGSKLSLDQICRSHFLPVDLISSSCMKYNEKKMKDVKEDKIGSREEVENFYYFPFSISDLFYLLEKFFESLNIFYRLKLNFIVIQNFHTQFIEWIYKLLSEQISMSTYSIVVVFCVELFRTKRDCEIKFYSFSDASLALLFHFHPFFITS